MNLQNLNKLDEVAVSIVNESGELGVFHYNKLIYLFEYLFIKNFGHRYTDEKFIKLPHGPVIKDYKKQIQKLFNLGLLYVDSEYFKTRNTLSDDDLAYCKVEIAKTGKSKNLIQNELVYDFLLKVLNKYSTYSVKELENLVYQTAPVKNYLAAVKEGRKKEKGGYILFNDCIRSKKYETPKAKGRNLALQHFEKYPAIKVEQYVNYSKEFEPLTGMRPQWEL